MIVLVTIIVGTFLFPNKKNETFNLSSIELGIKITEYTTETSKFYGAALFLIDRIFE